MHIIKSIKLIMLVIAMISTSITAQHSADRQEYGQVTADSAGVTQAELDAGERFFEDNILCALEGKRPAFDFCYGLKSFGSHLSEWTPSLVSDVTDSGRRSVTMSFAHRSSSLVMRCEAVKYAGYPTCEWTLWFENSGDSATPILHDVYALDAGFAIGKGDSPSLTEARLHYSKGGKYGVRDAFAPCNKALYRGTSITLGTDGDGRPSYETLPFFNLETASGGFVLAIGWPGSWTAKFKNLKNEDVNVKISHTVFFGALLPGETVRSPLVSVQPYSGSVMKGQNIFRRWILDYNSGNNQQQIINSGSIEYDLMQNATIENQVATLKKQLELGIPNEGFWMDAGWYENGNPWPGGRGTWDLDPERFPDGLKELTDLGKANGIKTVLWFEPETVMEGTYIATEHPEWLLYNGGKSNDVKQYLFDLSDSAAADWLSKHISGKIKEYGIGVYRQDFNVNPFVYWRKADTVRPGFTENKYVQNFLRFWDYLLADNPGLIIDNCASGGNRLCLETTRRSQPLWRNDECYEATAQQVHTYGLSYWLPYNGTGTILVENINGGKYIGIYTPSYAFRSCMSSTLIFVWDYSHYDAAKYAPYRELIEQYRSIREFYLGDYYPLTPIDDKDSSSVAMQYNSPEKGAGIITAYRRPDSKTDTLTLKLNGLESGTSYTVSSIDGGTLGTFTGSELAGGLAIHLAAAPCADVYIYSAVRN